ncbi:MAG: hypothetical protein J0H89_14065 [Rhizobiales bacterium]|jgi:hypothetical protein|nr:hypothetical protein [Hyphomicrobiales bacterium]
MAALAVFSAPLSACLRDHAFGCAFYLNAVTCMTVVGVERLPAIKTAMREPTLGVLLGSLCCAAAREQQQKSWDGPAATYLSPAGIDNGHRLARVPINAIANYSQQGYSRGSCNANLAVVSS